MALEWKKCFLSVPLDAQGLSDYDNWSDSNGHIYTVELSVSEYEALIEVFTKWNAEFGILIDIFEEETITANNAKRALEILQQQMDFNQRTKFLTAAEKLRIALAKAVEVHMPLHLDF